MVRGKKEDLFGGAKAWEECQGERWRWSNGSESKAVEEGERGGGGVGKKALYLFSSGFSLGLRENTADLAFHNGSC